MKLFTIPNLLTLGNLFCGALSCIIILFFDKLPFYYLLIAFGCSLIFDFLDGLVARILKQNSEFGIQLDSLADIVSFGLVPALAAYKLLINNNLNTYKRNYLELMNFHIEDTENMRIYVFINFIAFLILLFSALRLAKFNLDKEQSSYFKGLPTPANAIFFVFLFYNRNLLFQVGHKYTFRPFEFEYPLLIVLCIIFSFLLISNIPMFSFKFKNLSWKDNHYKYAFLGISLILLVLFQMNAVPFIILIYIIVSLIFRKKIVNA